MRELAVEEELSTQKQRSEKRYWEGKGFPCMEWGWSEQVKRRIWDEVSRSQTAVCISSAWIYSEISEILTGEVIDMTNSFIRSLALCGDWIGKELKFKRGRGMSFAFGLGDDPED